MTPSGSVAQSMAPNAGMGGGGLLQAEAPAATLLSPVLTPHGSLILDQTGEALEPARGERLQQAFARGSGHGLLSLGADEVGTTLPPALAYWREFGARYVAQLCALPSIGAAQIKSSVRALAEDELEKIAAAVPPMVGAEYLTAAVLADLWSAIDAAFNVELGESRLSVQDFLKSRHPA